MTEWIRFRPTPTDRELEAERDRQHQRDVAEWMARWDDHDEM